MMNARGLVSRGLASSLVLVSLVGCASIDVVHESAYCPGGQDRQALEVGNAHALGRLWQAIQPGPRTVPVPEVDFGQRRVLFLADQEHPTGGYGLSLASPRLTVNLGEASLWVKASRPEGMVSQVITRPCLLLSLPGGDYSVIRVHEASGGETWAEVTPVPEP